MAKAKAPKINKFQSAASRLAASFERVSRPGGESFVKVKAGAPEWVRDAVYAAHEATGDRGPCDWVYALCESAAAMIEEHAAEDDAYAAVFEWADAQCDVYTGQLFAWMAAHACNRSLCDEAVEHLGSPGDKWSSAQVEKFIQAGQCYGASRVAEVLIEAVVEQCS